MAVTSDSALRPVQVYAGQHAHTLPTDVRLECALAVAAETYAFVSEH